MSETPAPLFRVTGLSKRFGALAALSEVDLAVAAGEIHCLLGENGAGKSTLCNLVFGVYTPDAGRMELSGRPHRPAGPRDALAAGIAMVHQHFSLVHDMSVVDNLMLGRERGLLDRAGFGRRIAALGETYGLTVDPAARVGDLSIGERQRVEIVKCLMRAPKLLILDEPTAVLLPEEIASLLAVCRRVAAAGCGVVLVTHKLAEIKQVADRVTVLRGGRIVATSDAPATEIDRLVRAMIQRDLAGPGDVALSTLGLEAAAGAAAPEAGERRTRPADDVVQIDGLSLVNAAGATRLDGVTLTIGAGEIVGIAGVEGNGQSELGQILAGLLAPTDGRVFVAGRELTRASPREITDAGVGIVPEDRHVVGCITGMSVAENILLNRTARFTHFGLLRRGAMRRDAQALMQRFDVRAAGAEVPFGSLSGGNQQKAVLARELTTANLSFLLAAQPTRGLDVGAVEAVYARIREAAAAGVAILLVSSELDELLAVAHRVVVLYRGRIVGERPARAAEREAIGALMAGHGLGAQVAA